MGLLPFDDWIYHLPWMRDEVNSLHKQAVDTGNLVQSRVLAFNAQLDKFKTLISNNALLIMIDKMVRMNDLQLKDFTVDIDALPPPVKGDIVLNALSGTVELIGGIFLMKGIVNVGKLAKDAIFNSVETGAEDTSETVLEDLAFDSTESGIVSVAESTTTESLEATGEEVTEEVIEGATSSSLAATGIGIFLAVGMDVVFGAINGAKEKNQLQEQIDKLKKQLDLVNSYLKVVDTKSAKINSDTVTQINLFKNICTSMSGLLPAGHKPNFDFSFDADVKNLDKCLAAQQQAINQFGLLLQLRETYEKAKARNPNVTKSAVVNAVLLSSPDWVTEDLLNQIWDQVLAKYSTLMKNAK